MLIRILSVWFFVHRAPNTLWSLVQHVGVHHGSFHILVSQEFLQLFEYRSHPPGGGSQRNVCYAELGIVATKPSKKLLPSKSIFIAIISRLIQIYSA